MEENNKKSTKKTKQVIFLSVLLLLCVAGIVGAVVISRLDKEPAKVVQSTDEEYDWTTAEDITLDENGLPDDGSDITEVVKAEDTETLRELLLKNERLAIEITEQVMVDEPLLVNGTKKLQGTGSIVMEMDVKPYQEVLKVNKGAVLILDGVTVDGNGAANGVYVSSGAGLTCLSGEIIWGCPYGIVTEGTVAYKGGSIQNAIHTGLHVETGGAAYVSGGEIRDSVYCAVHSSADSYLKISGDADLYASNYFVVYNAGKCEITGGTLRDGVILAYTKGVMEVSPQGEEMLEWYNATSRGVLIGEEGTFHANKLYIHDTGSDAVCDSNGTVGVTLTDCKFERIGDCGARLHAECTLENITMTDCVTGLRATSQGRITVKQLNVINPKERGIRNDGGIITATDVTITNAGEFGVSGTKYAGDVCSTTINNLTIDGVGTKNGLNANNAAIVVSNATISNVGGAGAHTNNGGTIDLTNVKFTNIKGYNVHMTGESEDTTVKLKDVTIEGGKRGIQQDIGSVTATNVKISGTSSFGVNAKSGTTNLKNFTISETTEIPLNVAGATVTVKGLTISNATLDKYGVSVGEGSISIENSETMQSKIVGGKGGVSVAATASLKDLIIENAGQYGISVGGVTAKATLEHVNITNSGTNAVNIYKGGTAKLTKTTLSGTGKHAIVVSGSNLTGDVVTIESAGTNKADDEKLGGVYVASGANVTLSNLTVKDSSAIYAGIYVKSKDTQVVLTDADISTGERGIQQDNGSVTAKNVKINGTSSFGISANAGTMNFTDLTISEAGNVPLNVNGAAITVKGLTIPNTASDVYGVSVGKGSISIENSETMQSTITGGYGGVHVAATASLKDLTIADAGAYGVTVSGENADATLNNVNITNSGKIAVIAKGAITRLTETTISKAGEHGIYVEAETTETEVELTDVDISEVSRGIQQASGNVTGRNVKIHDTSAFGISANAGTMEFTNLAISKTGNVPLNVNGAAITVKGITVSDIPSDIYGVSVGKGSLIIENSETMQSTITGGKGGVSVSAEAELIGLTIENAGQYGVNVSGSNADATLTNVEIKNSTTYAVNVLKGGTADLTGTTIFGTGKHGIYVDASKLTGDVVTIESAGTNKDDGEKLGGVYAANGADVTLKNLTVKESSAIRGGIYILDETTQVSLEKVDISGVERGIQQDAGATTGTEVKIHDTSSFGISANAGTMDFTDLTISKTGNHALNVNGATIKVKGITVSDIASDKYGVSVGKGSIIVESSETMQSKISGCAYGVSTSATAILKELAIEKSGQYGVNVSGSNANASLTNVEITDSTTYAVNVIKGGTASLTATTISGTGKHGIYVDASKLTGDVVTIKSAGTNKADGEKLGGVCAANGADVTLKNLTVKESSAIRGGIYILDETTQVSLEKVDISGVERGIQQDTGATTGTEVKIHDTSSFGISANAGTMEFTNLAISKTGNVPLNVNGAAITVKGITVSEISSGIYGVSVGAGNISIENSESVKSTITGGKGGVSVSAEAELIGLTIENAGTYGVNVSGSKANATLTNVEIKDSTEYAVNVIKGGTASLTTTTISGTGKHGIYVDASTLIGDGVTITTVGTGENEDVKIGSVYAVNGADVTLKNQTSITNADTVYGVLIDEEESKGTKITLEGVMINGGVNGILNNNGTVIGTTVTIANTKADGVMTSGSGKTEINGLIIIMAGENGVQACDSSEVKLTNLSITGTTKYGVWTNSADASVTLSTAEISGGERGIQQANGTTTGANVTIHDTSSFGISTNGGTMNFMNLTIYNTGNIPLNVNGGTTTVKGINVYGIAANINGVAVAKGKSLTIEKLEGMNNQISGGNRGVSVAGTAILNDLTITGAQYGVYVTGTGNATLTNVTFDECTNDKHVSSGGKLTEN